jgi:GT2 family glycosyltransferase
MIFSIIIINYKTLKLTENCLDSLLKLSEENKISRDNLEIIVVDNASGDGSAENLKEKYSEKIKLIANHHNLGFAAANNQGAALAKGEYLLFLNSDTVLTEDIFSPSYKIFQEIADIGILSARLVNTEGIYQKAAYGRFPTLWSLITQSTKKEPQVEQQSNITKTDWLSGCALMIRKNIFQLLNGWDERFFLYYEDIDLCHRAATAGYASAIINNIKLIHLGGQSLNLNLKKRRYYYHSQDYYFRKHYGLAIELMVKIFRIPYLLILIINTSLRNK